MSEDEIKAFAQKHAEDLAAPIVRLCAKVIEKGIQGHLREAVEMKLRINALEATLIGNGIPLYEILATQPANEEGQS